MSGVIVRNGLQQDFQPVWSFVVIVNDVPKLVEGHDSIGCRKM